MTCHIKSALKSLVLHCKIRKKPQKRLYTSQTATNQNAAGRFADFMVGLRFLVFVYLIFIRT